jgi:16S rRNA (guanine(966)-N(2))-methyltransferase RsmD
MRVIAGTQRGRRLMAPRSAAIRPTADRVREALFSILGDRVTEARVLDLFAGTGAVGLEALSRGARQVTFVESGREALRLLRANLHRCGAAAAAEVRPCSVAAFFRRLPVGRPPYDIAFADPPYAPEAGITVLEALDRSAAVTATTTVVLEHATRLAAPAQVGSLIRSRQYRYGDTTLSVYHRTAGHTGGENCAT